MNSYTINYSILYSDFVKLIDQFPKVVFVLILPLDAEIHLVSNLYKGKGILSELSCVSVGYNLSKFNQNQ